MTTQSRRCWETGVQYPIGSTQHLQDRAAAWSTLPGQNIQALHHAAVLMLQDMAMHHKAPSRDRVEMMPPDGELDFPSAPRFDYVVRAQHRFRLLVK